jgi:tRNA (guanine-N7-)-methyltransferase
VHSSRSEAREDEAVAARTKVRLAAARFGYRRGMSSIEHPRAIRSFVTRAGRITDAQQRALDELWPKYGIEFEPRPLDLDTLFGRHAPHVVEIGFGNDKNIAALATARPERDYLGIEVHRAGVGRLMLEAERLQLANLRILCHDAVEVLEHQIPAQSLDEVLILFPDPWHKKRHHKRRLIQPQFVALLASRLRVGGVLRLATDWEPYALQMLEVLSADPHLSNLAADNAFIEKPVERITTRFEKRGERLGHGVWDLAFQRR